MDFELLLSSESLQFTQITICCRGCGIAFNKSYFTLVDLVEGTRAALVTLIDPTILRNSAKIQTR